MGVREKLGSAGKRIRSYVTSMALLSVPDHPSHGGLAGEGKSFDLDESADDEDDDQE